MLKGSPSRTRMWPGGSGPLSMSAIAWRTPEAVRPLAAPALPGQATTVNGHNGGRERAAPLSWRHRAKGPRSAGQGLRTREHQATGIMASGAPFGLPVSALERIHSASRFKAKDEPPAVLAGFYVICDPLMLLSSYLEKRPHQYRHLELGFRSPTGTVLHTRCAVPPKTRHLCL